MTVFLSCVKTSNDLKNHPFSQTKSRSQVSGSDIYSDFQRPESIIISSLRLDIEKAAVSSFLQVFNRVIWQPKKLAELF